jgi:hypothetical protein
MACTPELKVVDAERDSVGEELEEAWASNIVVRQRNSESLLPRPPRPRLPLSAGPLPLQPAAAAAPVAFHPGPPSLQPDAAAVPPEFRCMLACCILPAAAASTAISIATAACVVCWPSAPAASCRRRPDSSFLSNCAIIHMSTLAPGTGIAAALDVKRFWAQPHGRVLCPSIRYQNCWIAPVHRGL